MNKRTSAILLMHKHKAAMTLPELLIAAALVAVVLISIVFSYMTCLQLNELAKNSSIAVRSARTRLEQIKNTDFDDIKAQYDEVSFTPALLNGSGVSYVDDSNPDLLAVTVTVCWQQRNGRIIGEDSDLDG